MHIQNALNTFAQMPLSLLNKNSGYSLSCPINTPLSCSNDTVIEDSCCFEYPGGIFLQTQFWDYLPSFYEPKEELEKYAQNFTLHGLWPDNCDGSYAQFCDLSRNINYNVTEMLLNQDSYQSENLPLLDGNAGEALVEDMKTWWKSNNGNDQPLCVHEYNKHGTCIITMKPNCYSRCFALIDVSRSEDVRVGYAGNPWWSP